MCNRMTLKDSGRVLARKFKTCVRDSLPGATWRPGMKNVRMGIRNTNYGLMQNATGSYILNRVTLCTFLSLQNAFKTGLMFPDYSYS